MSIILNIDTSMETASVSIAKDGVIQSDVTNAIQKEHASFLHVAILQVLKHESLDINQVDAIAVTNGPGSYTGLRVGMAAAKGLCYAANKPLITIGTLDALAIGAIKTLTENETDSGLFCPMIDARRMEVYMSVFDSQMKEIIPACAMILEEKSLEKSLEKNRIYFFGSGMLKWKPVVKSPNASFIDNLNMTEAISSLSFQKLLNKDFTDPVYTEPLYIKEFFSS